MKEKKRIKFNKDEYCNCINPIFEHQWTQFEYLGFRCIYCGKKYYPKPLTFWEKIFLFLLFVTPFLLLLLILFYFNS